MRQLIFFITGLVLLCSCQNNDKEDSDSQKDDEKAMATDSLPEAKWNGEYMKIVDANEPKTSRKSLGSEFFKMGNVELKIGDKEMTYINFVRNKNVLSFTNSSIDAFITSAKNEQIHLHFKKNQIISNYKGKYKADPNGNTNSFFTMSISAREDGDKKEYTLQSGEADLIRFSTQLGIFVLNVKGVFTDKAGVEYKGNGKIKMNFESVVMSAP